MRALAIAGALFTAFFATHAAAQNSLLGEGRYVSLAGAWTGEADYEVRYPQDLAYRRADVESGASFQVAAGARGGPFRLEGAFTYRAHDVQNSIYSPVTATTPVIVREGDLDARTFDFNVYYDLPTGQPFRPYVGAGIGLANVSFSDGSLEDDDSSMHVQGIAGLSFDVAPRASLFVEGRWQRIGDVNVETFATDANGNTVEGTDEFNFNNTAAFAGVRFGF